MKDVYFLGEFRKVYPDLGSDINSSLDELPIESTVVVRQIGDVAHCNVWHVGEIIFRFKFIK